MSLSQTLVFRLRQDDQHLRELVRLVSDDLMSRSVGELVERLGMNQPAVSKQLRVLRESGLATVRVEAQRRIYRLNPDGLREVDDWLAPFRAFWEERLDAMERTLDSMED